MIVGMGLHLYLQYEHASFGKNIQIFICQKLSTQIHTSLPQNCTVQSERLLLPYIRKLN